MITPVAALWTSTSNGPSSAASAATRSEATLPRRSSGSAPAARSSSAVSSAARSFRRYPIATRAAPCSANRSAIALPIPREPPVTSTDAPSKELIAPAAARSAGAELGISSQPGTSRRTLRALVRLGRGVTEPVEQLHLLLRVAPHLVVLGQVEHELLDAGAQLVGEVRRRRPDERVDLVDGGLSLRHGQKPNG